ncbi:Major Facilitator Superfamily protein [Sporothrix schenckii 1099-18]|uniref:Molybdate-anion transporter n=1 Tax=Sporothrix schenckii 1099-18 TaxID=1397361 RepID=A0A0F2LYH2_SPOSC|nr:Major Facilitator Superfamily protein [Sporothrix schenckii 1099-18]KJR82512.1 Major Facilitator Superfamily protein [Sporothrix schenckii 1099-18]
MDIYKANLTGLVGLCAALYAGQQFWQSPAEQDTQDDSNTSTGDSKSTGSAKQEKKALRAKKAREGREAAAAAHAARASDFLSVYALVMAADWLQGPFLYSLYTDEHHVSPTRVPLLFATGFVAGGVSASVVGGMADQHGRKRACLVFCGTYAASCALTVLSASLPVLLMGRVLGGVSTSLLFSVFESWMVTDFWENEKFGAANITTAIDIDNDRAAGADADDKKEKDESERQASARLSHTFGRMGTLNSLAAIASGVFSELVVAATGTRKAPFVASAVLLGIAAWRIVGAWEENFGEAATKDRADGGGRVLAVLRDPVVLVLGLASTLFEGSMYLFVFFWTPALKQAAESSSSASSSTSSSPSSPSLPYGIIFASFMAAAMAATLAFNVITAQLRLMRCATLLLALLGAAEVVFYLLSSSSSSLSEQSVFWLFCLFEACVGTYWPCMGFLKGQLVPDGARAQVYALLRVPLNVFVVAALLLTRDGTYAAVFGVCSTLLLAAIAGVVAMMLNEPDLP